MVEIYGGVYIHLHVFSYPVQIYEKSFCMTPCVSHCGGCVCKLLKFYFQVLLMGKGLLGKLTCTRTGLVSTVT